MLFWAIEKEICSSFYEGCVNHKVDVSEEKASPGAGRKTGESAVFRRENWPNRP